MGGGAADKKGEMGGGKGPSVHLRVKEIPGGREEDERGNGVW